MRYILSIKRYISSIWGLRTECMCLSAKAPITKYHRLWDLHKRTLFSHNSGGWKSKTKMMTGLISGMTSLSLAYRSFLLCWHMAFSLDVCAPGGVSSSSYMNISTIRLGPFWPHCTLITSFKVAYPNTVTIGDRASIYEFVSGAHFL